MKFLLLAFLLLLLGPGCGEIPGRTKVADCTTGPVYRYNGELICDDFQQGSFASRKWMDDTALTACMFCEVSK